MPDTNCSLCPRRCAARRKESSGAGFCGVGTLPVVGKAMRHFWEEPCVSGEKGTGAVFFAGCPLGCVYCQNYRISAGRYGKAVSPARLRAIYFELIGQGVHNISLITPTHFTDAVTKSLEGGLPVPVVWNTGGYDRVESLRRLEGKVQIYLPDMKYAERDTAARYSMAPDYPEAAKSAVMEMYRQTGPYVLGGDGLLQRGVLIRHLVLPGNLDNTRRVIDWVAGAFSPGQVLFSLMSQYTPVPGLDRFPELQRRLTPEEYDEALDYMEQAGIEDGFFQELSSAKEEYTPDFDLEGV
jgi:putative pyruvate formate lyase activating enzyme